jgi:hypothetical protein
VVDRLGAVEKHTPDTMASIQTDVMLLQGQRVAPRMLEDLVGQRFEDPMVQAAV